MVKPGGIDLLGVNYYATQKVRRYSGAGPRQQADGHKVSAGSPWVGADELEFVQVPGPYTAMGWNIDPQGLVDLLLSLHGTYPDQPLLITENGAAFADEVSPDGRVHDVERVAYLHDHIDAVGEAIEPGKILVAAYVIRRPGAALAPDALVAWGREHLAAYKAPRIVYLVEDFPRTRNGKIQRPGLTPAAALSRSTGR